MTGQASILLIYTGGTIGMVKDEATGTLKPFNFDHLTEQIPELSRFNVQFSTYSFEQPIDSSEMSPSVWVEIAGIIAENYSDHNGFVILHGSDTMAYTASALSFMLENLGKPVILTGSQLPIGIIRTDAKENLITAIEIAASKDPVIPEVCIYFEYHLYRGNRTSKVNAEDFEAFRSFNYPELATAGVHLKYNRNAIAKPGDGRLTIHDNLNTDIAILKLFPGISEHVVRSVISTEGLKALVLETFGSGNGPTAPWFSSMLAEAIGNGLIIINITQCLGGAVEQGKYQASAQFEQIGVISGKDMTTEAAVTKLMFLMGKGLSVSDISKQLQQSLRGELTTT